MKKIIPIIVGVVLAIFLIVSFVLYNYTEVFGKKVLPVKVNGAVISYTPGSGDDSIVETQEIMINDKDFSKVTKLLKGVKKSTSSSKNNNYIATLTINKDYIISIGEGYGVVNKTNVSIPNSLYNYVYDIINDNDSKLFKEIQFSKASIHGNGARIDISNEDNIKTIKNALNYYGVDINEEFSSYNGGYKYILKLDDGMQILLYDNGVGYISKAGDDTFNKYFIFRDNLYEIVQNIYNVSIADEKK